MHHQQWSREFLRLDHVKSSTTQRKLLAGGLESLCLAEKLFREAGSKIGVQILGIPNRVHATPGRGFGSTKLPQDYSKTAEQSQVGRGEAGRYIIKISFQTLLQAGL